MSIAEVYRGWDNTKYQPTLLPPAEMSPNPNSPPGESAADLWFERSNFDGAILGGVAYGT